MLKTLKKKKKKKSGEESQIIVLMLPVVLAAQLDKNSISHLLKLFQLELYRI